MKFATKQQYFDDDLVLVRLANKKKTFYDDHFILVMFATKKTLLWWAPYGDVCN